MGKCYIYWGSKASLINVKNIIMVTCDDTSRKSDLYFSTTTD
jgi:hypothetical protein